jgi:hypothetical protein
MKRLHLFEIEDEPWCPPTIRLAITEFLATFSRLTKIYRPTVTILEELMRKASEKRLVVLGAGSGGGIMDIIDYLPRDTEVTLTDLFPHQGFQTSNPRVRYLTESVNATSIPKDLEGIRVMYTFFHHLRPEMAKTVLENAVNDKQAIAIFEITERSIVGILNMFLVPIVVLFVTPMIRPFRWSRLLFTYVIPILPLALLWDGIVSAFRTYDGDDIRELVANFPTYDWKIGFLEGPHKERISSVTGVSK